MKRCQYRRFRALWYRRIRDCWALGIVDRYIERRISC
jgi:hypothetical protein